jgi:hypothetical protein
MLGIRVDISGDKRALAQLRKMIHEFDDWKPELKAVGDYLVDLYQNPVFETEGGYFGARWQALTPVYAQRKAVTYPGRGILEASGALRRSYRREVFRNLVSIINDDPKAELHHLGKGRLPVRLIMKVDEKQKDQIVDIFKKGGLIKLKKALA